MDAIVQRKELIRALKWARSQTKKSGMKSLFTETVLIEAKEDFLRLVGANIEGRSIIVKLAAEIEEEGAICVYPAKLIDVLTVIPDEWVNLTEGEKFQLEVSGAHLIYLLDAEEVTEKTYALRISDRICSIPAGRLLPLARQVIHAASTDPDRVILQHISVNGSITATNGFQAAVVEETVTDLKGLIPAKFIADALRLFPDAEEIMGWVDGPKMALSDGTITLETGLAEGHFPKIADIEPKEFVLELEFDTRELLNAIRQVATVRGRGYSPPLRMTIAPDGSAELEISTDEFSAITMLFAEINPLKEIKFPFLIAFNPDFLVNALSQAANRVRLFIAANNRAVIIRPVDPENHWRGLIMPMHLG